MRKRCGSARVALWRGSEDLRRTSGGCLAWLESVSRSEGGETGGARLCPWALVEPRDNAVDIDGSGGRDVLHVGLGQAPIPRAPQPKRTHSLGERAFDASPPLIALHASLTGVPGPGRCERLVLVLGWQPQPAALLLSLGA
jgi:hypothetical protein